MQHQAFLASGSPEKAVKAMYNLTALDDPPLHLPLHRYAIDQIRQKLASVAADVDKYESWSDNITFDKN
jgi:hypothetical protein